MTERYAHKSTERMKANSQKLSLKNVATVSSVTPPQKMAIKINDFQGIMMEAKGFEPSSFVEIIQEIAKNDGE